MPNKKIYIYFFSFHEIVMKHLVVCDFPRPTIFVIKYPLTLVNLKVLQENVFGK